MIGGSPIAGVPRPFIGNLHTWHPVSPPSPPAAADATAGGGLAIQRLWRRCQGLGFLCTGWNRVPGSPWVLATKQIAKWTSKNR